MVLMGLTPKEIVAELDKYIVGQDAAKKAVAIALRNRYRRKLLDADLQEEIYPKNIIMIGATGVGKTEIARRLARLVNAPFIKVEASKFTEVGYVGRDVESMVRELTETTVRAVKNEKMEEFDEKSRKLAEERLLEFLVPSSGKKSKNSKNPLEFFFNQMYENDGENKSESSSLHEEQQKEILKQKLERKELENEIIEIEQEEKKYPFLDMFSGYGMEEMGANINDALGSIMPKNKKKRKVSIEEARKILAFEEGQKLVDMDEVGKIALNRVEEDGIIFLDEIDKIAGKNSSQGPDVSREGVQRDILPIVEGSTVTTKYGPVKTDHILFIAAGAFHISKPSDLIPELQGRFPIRVELKSLTCQDLKRILTEPNNSLIKQYTALLKTEDVEVAFTEDAIDYIAEMAFQVNARTENIGARRLHTIMEKVLEELLFEAPYLSGQTIKIDREYVGKRLEKIVVDEELSKYIL
ncbi:MAG: ATP-dependent protease ATPase subunit HslU [Syntrophomonadaceae bacterium]|jgi:ATP-dependent HslUV protease ATP-binding subunit HslU|nr:ATP-dependent protease ATPase subunit HslU [Syntrophomonadaceae bacterium]